MLAKSISEKHDPSGRSNNYIQDQHGRFFIQELMNNEEQFEKFVVCIGGAGVSEQQYPSWVANGSEPTLILNIDPGLEEPYLEINSGITLCRLHMTICTVRTENTTKALISAIKSFLDNNKSVVVMNYTEPSGVNTIINLLTHESIEEIGNNLHIVCGYHAGDPVIVYRKKFFDLALEQRNSIVDTKIADLYRPRLISESSGQNEADRMIKNHHIETYIHCYRRLSMIRSFSDIESNNEMIEAHIEERGSANLELSKLLSTNASDYPSIWLNGNRSASFFHFSAFPNPDEYPNNNELNMNCNIL